MSHVSPSPQHPLFYDLTPDSVELVSLIQRAKLDTGRGSKRLSRGKRREPTDRD